MYNPHELRKSYLQLEHGKARIAGIRHAMKEADKQGDLPFQLYFRLRLCHESTFYDDAMDLFIVFPEVLALVDKHPDIPVTTYNNNYINGMENVLWAYKWLLADCTNYYQIPLEDCKGFFEDFKRRSLAFGFNLKEYYNCLEGLYKYIDEELAEQYRKEYIKLPRDGNANCAACERNNEIEYYLEKGDMQKAEELSKDIENFTLTCGDKMSAWLRLKSNYMMHYMEQREFEKVESYCRLIERHSNGWTEYECWDKFLYCYTYTNIGKALKIYKEHWKEWLNERCPRTSFDTDKYIWVFFRELAKQRKTKTIKLHLDNTFPLYREDETYVIEELAEFYYKKAWDTALKFDNRNGSDWFRQDLKRLES